MDWEHSLAEVLDGKYPLHRFIEGDETHGVFLTGFAGEKQLQKAIVRIFCLDEQGRNAALARWKRTAELSHPHLVDAYATGETQIDGNDVVYMVCEFPDESLSEVIPDRALTDEEARDFLKPTLDVLSYLHAKGFAHSAIRPSNLFAVGDRLKVSRDDVRPTGDRGAISSPYSAPELSTTGSTPAGDIWSLCVTLVEVLTQRVPPSGPSGVRAAANLPNPFAEIIRNSLATEPRDRWTVAKILSALEGGATASSPEAAKRPVSTAKVARGALVAIGILVVAGVVARPWLMPDDTDTAKPKSSESSTPVKESASGKNSEANKPSTSEPTRPALTPAQKRAADRKAAAEKKIADRKAAAEKKIADRKAASDKKAADDKLAADRRAADQKKAGEKKQADAKQPAKPQETPKPAEQKATQPAPAGDVVQQVLPEITDQARATIQGKFSSGIRVTVNASGDVVSTAVDSRGPSWFFADLAKEAAKKWKFAPAAGDTPRDYVIQFQFQRAGTKVGVRKVQPK